jgi:16S rRNA C1402 N4-methylase RsmH
MPTDTKVEPLTEEQKLALEKAKALLEEQKKVTFGDGRYSQAMKELFQDSKRLLALTDKQAEKLARSFGAELGKHNAIAKISYGRYSVKSNQITLKESVTFKGLIVTFAISLARLCVCLQESIQFGFDHEKSKIELRAEWIEWLNK